MNLLSHIGAIVLSLPYGSVAVYLVGVTFAYFTLKTIFRLTVHPLAKYPSPTLLEAISDWPMIIQCYKGNRHIKLLQGHEKYGSVIRVGPNTVSFNTTSALQAIHTDRIANVGRDEWYKSLDISQGAYSTQSCMSKSEHAFRRRVISQAFSERALRDAEGFIMNNVRIFCDGIGTGAEKAGEWTPKLNMGNWATYFGFDFIVDLTFGRAFGLLFDEEKRYIPAVLMWTSQFLYYVGYLPFRALVRPFLGTVIQDYVGGKAASESYKFTQLANSRMAERLRAEEQAKISGKETRKDVFRHILTAKDPDTGKGFTKEELQADSALLLAAGSDGVALTISACVFYLLHNPSVYDKLVAEIRGAFASAEEIRTPKLNSLPYLMACVQETMRISPALPASFPRVVLPGGITIPSSTDDDDSNTPIHIPAGTTVFVPPYAIQHNETYYPDSWSFRPERWLVSEGTPVASVARARKAYCPFGTGPMDCAGKNMAYLALKLVVANMLWRYNIRLAEAKVVDGPLAEWEMGPTGGGNVEAREEGRRRVGEYQIIDFMAGYRDGPTVQLRERVAG